MPGCSDALTRRALVAALLTGALAGCASLSGKPEDVVRARAQARWDALLKGDYERAYGYITPGGRAVVPYATYRGRIGNAVTWKSAEVASVTCETLEKCTVKVKVTYLPAVRRAAIGTIERFLDETWVVDAGQWWFVYKF
ncbi:MAG: hypothetical protein HXY24_00930 [Rubrivivax sp.]|nr:hypothetical protein [Rubrivivax sp.]